ncbi:unnamed protein product [Moneuplotes crassus]|uniref:Autophagy protein ATG17-like domain-containing protein n=1 Tax=Euplotes crassus TaxID=5936 RepID=A0AAD1U278_EUPCR|nr:unnamed protein product [Moneuplotes crassus]
MEKQIDENAVGHAQKFLANSSNIEQFEMLLCKHFDPGSVSDGKKLYFMKKIYRKFLKSRQNAADLLNHLEKIKLKEKEADSLKKTLLSNQKNQSKDILEMEKAIKDDITQYLKDLRTYKDKYAYLQKININPALTRGEKHTLADYVSLEEIEESKENLDSNKEKLLTRLKKLNQNNQNLQSMINGLQENVGEHEKEMPYYSKLLSNAYQKLKEIGRRSGLTEFDSNPDLLGKGDHEWKSSDKDQYKVLSDVLKTSLDTLEELSASIEILSNKYINMCKKNFDKLLVINKAIGINEGERIKTLKNYEGFKKEYKYFQIPKCLPKCYNESIMEIKRRDKYNKFFKYILDKLKAIWEYENKKRDQFLNKNGLYIPKRLLPQLGNKAPFFRMNIKEIDLDECPQGLILEQDKYINGVDSKVYYFEKVFADLMKKMEKSSKHLNPKTPYLSSEVAKLKAEIKAINASHEKDLLKITKPYKEEICNLTVELQELKQKDQERTQNVLKDAEQKIIALKTQNADLSNQHMELKNQLSLQIQEKSQILQKNEIMKLEIEQLNTTKIDTERLNQLMSEAITNLKIPVELPADETFFESGFKQLCKRYYELMTDVKHLVSDDN